LVIVAVQHDERVLIRRARGLFLRFTRHLGHGRTTKLAASHRHNGHRGSAIMSAIWLLVANTLM
jgi:hypothetical protein